MFTIAMIELVPVLAMGPGPGTTVPMAIIVPAQAVVLAAFVVWLGVRIVNRRERWAKRTAIGLVVGLPLLYVLSIGPAVWLMGRGYYFGRSIDGRRDFAGSFFWPVLRSAAYAPSSIGKAVSWWGSVGVPDDEWVYLDIELDDRTVVVEFPESAE
jgi:hypothetical protein